MRKATIQEIMNKYRTVIVLVLIFVIATMLSPAFLSLNNIFNVIRQVAITAILGAGMTFVILTGGIDLSVGSILALAGALSAGVLGQTGSIILAILVAIGIGALCGAANGLFITKGEMPPFIATLGMMTLIRGCVLVYTNGSPVTVKSAAYKFIGKGYLLGIPVPVILLIVIFAIGYVILTHTKFGRSVYAFGGNREATRLSGINIVKTEWYVYLISGILAGIAGIILTSRLGSAQPTAGTGYELDAIAAVILGGTSLAGGQGFILPTVLGALILGIIDNILVLMNVNSFVASIVKGAVILIAVLADKKFKDLSLKAQQADSGK